MDMVLEMYGEDFDIFGYEKTIPNRPELISRVDTQKVDVQGQNCVTDVNFPIAQQPEDIAVETARVDPGDDGFGLGLDLAPDIRSVRSSSNRSLSASTYVDQSTNQGYRSPAATITSVNCEDEEAISRKRAASAFVLVHQ
eukprot:CAMPEP_0204834120 /NCGR_PEP_ID=MMETSP1346-20131115/18843_1 /ASSEMBLY_ACC=CAM_ASM_000771 /TAXON_ID=215587 /ORGANISM="Aplanochytrium stocchinoi, Strain GSBS06" /LENGTH=139 /DNA_ID=CAMNT_0051967171 /DNA_START=35 /DNA_END=454 /DNA_ORIENTATION=+